MIKFLAKTLVVILVCFTSILSASHTVGGYFRYECKGLVGTTPDSVDYSVEFRFYRDGLNGDPRVQMPANIPVTIFDSAGVFIRVQSLPRVSLSNVPDNISNPCVVDIPRVDVEEGIFRGTIRLARDKGHQFVYQRCCRNEIIQNLADPPQRDPIDNPLGTGNAEFYGNTFQIDVPQFDVVGCNSSPDFVQQPPIVLCFNFDVKESGLNLTAIDTLDNDSLVYSLCAPLDFNQAFYLNNPGLSPAPFRAFPPPYGEIPFKQSAIDPIPSNPAITINPETGQLSGLPSNTFETYVIGICVEEYRKSTGELMSITRRDIQISTGNCDLQVLSAVQDQRQFCDGFEVQFVNTSLPNDPNNFTYKWDFGVSGVLEDTSNLFEPIFDYGPYGRGTYDITLIVNPGLPCSDTSNQTFDVFPLLDPDIEIDGLRCKDSNSVNFEVGGAVESYATYEWDFGNFASIKTSTEDSVGEVEFSGVASTFQVRLTVSQDGCSKEVVSDVQLIDNPTIDFIAQNTAGCYPLPVDFTNLSTSIGRTEYSWAFGDDSTSTEENPTHVYRENGLYSVTFELRTTEGCIDTLRLTKDNIVDISLDSANNIIAFDVAPQEGCLPLTVSFTDASTFDGTPSFFWDFGDGNLSAQQNATNVYSDTGIYSIGLLVITSGKCTDTLVKTFDSLIRVRSNPIVTINASDTVKSLKQAFFQFDNSGSQFVEASKYLINGVEVDTNNILNYQFQDTGRFKVEYVGFNEFGCTDTSEVEVFVFDEFEFLIPNVFSPNGDAINETFAIRACGVYEYEIAILNRFGEKVFESNSLNINWDGRFRGRKANSGVYFYTIRIKDFRGEYLNYNGTVTVIAE